MRPTITESSKTENYTMQHYYWLTGANVVIRLRHKLPNRPSSPDDKIQYCCSSFNEWHPKMLYIGMIHRKMNDSPILKNFINYGVLKYKGLKVEAPWLEQIEEAQRAELSKDRTFRRLRKKVIRLVKESVHPLTVFKHKNHPKRILLMNFYTAIPNNYTDCMRIAELSWGLSNNTEKLLSNYIPINNQKLW